jgi:hypothetical protein
VTNGGVADSGAVGLLCRGAAGICWGGSREQHVSGNGVERRGGWCVVLWADGCGVEHRQLCLWENEEDKGWGTWVGPTSFCGRPMS